MDFDDIFESSHKHKSKHHRYEKGYDHHKHHDYYEYPRNDNDEKHHKVEHQEYGKFTLNMLQKNPYFKWIAIAVALIIILLLIVIISFAYPLIGKLLNFVSENGIKGVIDLIWSGSK